MPRKLNQRVPKDLETIVLKCLRKDPGDRYGTAEALGQDLRRFVRGDPIEARAEPAVQRFCRFLRRNRTRLIVTAALLVVMMVCTAFGFALAKERSQRRRSVYVTMVEQAIIAIELGQRPSVVKSEEVSFEAYPGDVDEWGADYCPSVLARALENLEEAKRLNWEFPSRLQCST